MKEILGKLAAGENLTVDEAEQAQEEAKAEKDKADANTQQKKNELDAAKKELDDFKATVSAAGSKGFFESLYRCNDSGNGL